MNLQSENNPESLSDFNQLSEAQKREWLNSQTNILELPDGVRVLLAPNRSFVITYEVDSYNLIVIIDCETLQDAQKRILTALLAERAMTPTN